MTALITLFLAALVPLVPTEPVLLAVGVLAASGKVPLAGVITVAAVACSISDHLLYAFGRVAGVRALNRFGRRASVAAATDWLSRHITRWGALVLVVGRWLPAGGTIGAVLTGTLRWRLIRFTPASVVGSTLWSSYVALVGYFGGEITGEPLAGIIISLALATLLALVISFALQRAHRNRIAAAETDDSPSGDDPLSPGQAAGVHG